MNLIDFWFFFLSEVFPNGKSFKGTFVNFLKPKALLRLMFIGEIREILSRRAVHVVHKAALLINIAT